ncbi:MAG: AAA family ATPase [Lentisphaerota bacterium]
MKQLISQLIDDFHERKLPELLDRDQKLPVLKGKASVVIGMRRTGKTFFCFQRIRKLLSSGTPVNQILYLNFEDDHLLDFSVKDFQSIITDCLRKHLRVSVPTSPPSCEQHHELAVFAVQRQQILQYAEKHVHKMHQEQHI